jgi:hypothetical protein
MIDEYQICIDGASIIGESGNFRVSPIVLEHLKKRFRRRFGEILKELQVKRAYIMNFGYTWEHDPRTPHIDQFKNIYLFRKLEILTIVNNLQRAYRLLSKEYIHMLWKNLIMEVYGEQYEAGRSFNDYAKMRDGIRYRNLSKLFDKTQQQILSLSRDEINKILERITETKNRLNALLLEGNSSRFFGPRENQYIWLYDFELP